MTQLDAPFDLDAVGAETPTQHPAQLASRNAKFAKRLPSLVGFIVPSILLVSWAVAAKKQWVAPQILPTPAAVGRTLLEQLESGELFKHIAISLGRVAGGFFVGGVLGVSLGIAMGLSRRLEQYLRPSFNALSQVPVLGWLPLAMMVLGIGESLKVAIITQAALIPIAVQTLKGIHNVPEAYLDVAHAFQFSKRQRLSKVVLPAAVPSIFVGIRYGLTQAWLSLVTVELLASSEGLGFLIVWGRQLFQLDLVLAAILVVGVVGLVLDRGLQRLEARLLRWRPSGSFGSEAGGAP